MWLKVNKRAVIYLKYFINFSFKIWVILKNNENVIKAIQNQLLQLNKIWHSQALSMRLQTCRRYCNERSN